MKRGAGRVLNDECPTDCRDRRGGYNPPLFRKPVPKTARDTDVRISSY